MRPWPKRSTREFFWQARRVHFGPLEWLHAYIYLRWPYQYIAVGTGERRGSAAIGRWWERLGRLFGDPTSTAMPPQAVPGKVAGATPAQEAFAHTYHGKVTRLDDARQLVTFEQPIKLTASEQVIPYRQARDIVLQDPEHIAVLDCPCRAARANPCLPLDVCLIVGEPFASFVIEHHPTRARWIDPQQAVQILQQEHERGHVHHAFFKDVMLGRFYAICNCCRCCCGAMQAYRNGTPMLASSGYVSRVDEDACIACGTCEQICPFDAVSVPDDADAAVVDGDLCMGCGVCVDACPTHAHELLRDPDKGEPLEIAALAAGCPMLEGLDGRAQAH